MKAGERVFACEMGGFGQEWGTPFHFGSGELGWGNRHSSSALEGPTGLIRELPTIFKSRPLPI